jgi:hypothetical protein
MRYMTLSTITTFRFSLTKWIHLNGGDQGLKSFFKRVYEVLNQGGAFVLEPQAWETYVKARKMDKVRIILGSFSAPLIRIDRLYKKTMPNCCSDRTNLKPYFSESDLAQDSGWVSREKEVRHSLIYFFFFQLLTLFVQYRVSPRC